jgi:hypothetical protein
MGRFLIRKMGLWPLLLLCGQLLFLSSSARADVWAYMDERGVAHVASEQLDARYEVFFRGGESFDTEADLSGVQPLVPDGRPNPALVSASPARTFFDVSPGFKAIGHHVREAANTFHIDYELLQAIIATESGFDAQALSPKGAIGLMQVMPATAERFGMAADKKNSLEKKLTDPRTNIRAGSRYLNYLLDLFPGELELAVAAYNAGEGAVQRAGNRIPKYQETQNYVKTVMQLYRVLKPPMQLPFGKQAPTRIRMAFGGAVNRSNMPATAIPQVPRLVPNTDTQ